MAAFGLYLLCLGINYVPLLLHAIDVTCHGNTKEEIGELGEQRAAFRKYRRQSLLLLVPFVMPLAAIVQELARKRSGTSEVTAKN